MARRTLLLTQREELELLHVRDHHPRPYMREKASALLQIAAGKPAYLVALYGLLRRRKPDTVYGWLNEYEKHRTVQPHKVRRRRFSPL